MKLIGIGIIGNSNYIGTILSGSIQEVKPKEKPYLVSSRKIFIGKYFRTYHLGGHSKLKELYTNDLFRRKQMIEGLEAELTGALKET